MQRLPYSPAPHHDFSASPDARPPCTCGPRVRECPTCAAHRTPTVVPLPSGPVQLLLYGRPVRWCKYRPATIQKLQRLLAQGWTRRWVAAVLTIPYSTVGYLKEVVIVPLTDRDQATPGAAVWEVSHTERRSHGH